MPYDKFSRFYDLVMDDRSAAARYIAGLIACHNPYAKTVLEIACGTGAILGKLSASYEVTGLDRSKPMLALARKKFPHVHFFHQDMTTFQIRPRFDAIVCAFDSINHLLRFADWERTFRSVQRHLNAGGLFIFDVNTLGKLQRLAQGPAWEKWFDRDLVIIKVAAAPRNQYIWDVKIFEHQRRERYDLIHDEIPEAAFPLRRIVGALRVKFDSVKVLDPFGARASDRSERLYFVCKAAKR
jgi:SAM-dependent methyltransferase